MAFGALVLLQSSDSRDLGQFLQQIFLSLRKSFHQLDPANYKELNKTSVYSGADFKFMINLS